MGRARSMASGKPVWLCRCAFRCGDGADYRRAHQASFGLQGRARPCLVDRLGSRELAEGLRGLWAVAVYVAIEATSKLGPARALPTASAPHSQTNALKNPLAH